MSRYPINDAIPLPVPTGFMLQGFRDEGKAVGFGRDDPEWIGGEDINFNPNTEKKKKKKKEKKTGDFEEDRGEPENDDTNTDILNSDDANVSTDDKPSKEIDSPEKMSIIVDGKEIGKVRESVVTGSALAELLFEEAEEKDKEVSHTNN